MNPYKVRDSWPKSVTHGNVTIRVYRNAEPTKAGGFTHVLA